MVSLRELTDEYSKLQKRFDQTYGGRQRLLVLEEMRMVLDRIKALSKWSN